MTWKTMHQMECFLLQVIENPAWNGLNSQGVWRQGCSRTGWLRNTMASLGLGFFPSFNSAILRWTHHTLIKWLLKFWIIHSTNIYQARKLLLGVSDTVTKQTRSLASWSLLSHGGRQTIKKHIKYVNSVVGYECYGKEKKQTSRSDVLIVATL